MLRGNLANSSLSWPQKGFIIRQYDIEGAFLNGPFEEVLYVVDRQATGDKAWLLKKSLYGTKQAAHNWNKVIDDILKGLGFIQCKDDLGLYYRVSDGELIVIHVDDLLCGFSTSMPLSHVLHRCYDGEVGGRRRPLILFH